MSRLPARGGLLPRFAQPAGIEVKLRTYLLVLDHKVGGSKAKGFPEMLGIDLIGLQHHLGAHRSAGAGLEEPHNAEAD